MLVRGVHLLQIKHQHLQHIVLQQVRRHAIWTHIKNQKCCTHFSNHARSRLSGELFMRCAAGSGSGGDGKIPLHQPQVATEEIKARDGDEAGLSTTPALPKNTIAITQTKNYEVKTPKGILTITTTIEDSKINEIVFEKSDLSPVVNLAEPHPATSIVPEDVVKTQPPIRAPPIDPKTVVADVRKPVPAAVPLTIKRPRFDYRASLERNFVTPMRAMSDFLLTQADLDTLPKIKRRSPYEQEPPMTVYWRRDVEAKALSVWGTRENLLRERLNRDIERKQHQQNLFTVKRRLRDYRREIGSRTNVLSDHQDAGKSSQVVTTAIAINAANLLFKFAGWLYSGSHSMFAETIHSLADLINQLILAFGIYKSSQKPDTDHPYGYMNMRYVSSLISGVGIFCVGSGLSIYHGIEGILNPEPITDLFWVYCILMGSLVSEGATLLVAINELKRAARQNQMSFKRYVLAGKDPCVNVVLCEDAAAVAGVLIAGVCMGLSSYTGSPIYDAAGSLVIGALLGSVASFIIYTNANALVGISIPSEQLERMNTALEADVMIRAIHDVKGIDIGNGRVRYKAEVDFDGRELTRSYLDKHDLGKLLATVQTFRNTEDLESFLLNHGENIVDLMGGEIDRIEMNLRTQFPEIRHVDLEIL